MRFHYLPVLFQTSFLSPFSRFRGIQGLEATRRYFQARYHADSQRSGFCRDACLSSTFNDNDDVKRERTRYTIDDETCAPLEVETIQSIVHRHLSNLDAYISNKPIAAHTKEAFRCAEEFVNNFRDADGRNRKIIFDSGCGTGRSTLIIGKMYPDCVVIGIDRSISRLNRNSAFRGQKPFEDDSHYIEAISVEERPNVIMLRAELADFWRCAIEAKWLLYKHYILYPNPYPKKARQKSRWHLHSSFPFILKLGGEITLRSNWVGYLEQFALAVQAADQFFESDSNCDNCASIYRTSSKSGPYEYNHHDKNVLSNFEQKYILCGEKIYELVLKEFKPKSISSE